MKTYQITYEIIFAVEAEDEKEASRVALQRIEAFLEAPDDLRTLLQAAVMDTEPIIKELKGVT